MIRLLGGSTGGLLDAEAFLDTLDVLAEHGGLLDGFFRREADLFVARAPGRLDVMGGIADYSGSLVLELPLAEATFAAVQDNPGGGVDVISLGEDDRVRRFSAPLDAFQRDGEPLEYAEARELFREAPWAAYVAGALLVLARECGLRPEGFRLFAASAVPEGRGVSSSAALEVAAMHALLACRAVAMSPEEVASLCQLVENLVVGAPCGIMDQMTAMLGQSGRLFALHCQPATVVEGPEIPVGLRFWGIDSGVHHEVSGDDYTSVRTGAFMGYRILADLLGFPVQRGPGGRVTVADPRFGGYLTNVPAEEWTRELAARVPREMEGAEFLRRHGGTTDPVTRVQPGRRYAIRIPTAHPILEQPRVQRFAEILRQPFDDAQGARLGELMDASHRSYSACGLGSPGTDRLVELVAAHGLYGARITGGGSGGTVAIAGRADALPAVQEIARQYREETGRGGGVFAGSSPGAAAFGVLRIRR